MLQGVIAIPCFEIQRITFSTLALGILVNDAQNPIESNLAVHRCSLLCIAANNRSLTLWTADWQRKPF
ncbi:MAG: hypothetical protein VX542_01215, partial [Cyanobacteriota bacterium]|nr:hypothetical protein [Cyanobacteriota bacterium]